MEMIAPSNSTQNKEERRIVTLPEPRLIALMTGRRQNRSFGLILILSAEIIVAGWTYVNTWPQNSLFEENYLETLRTKLVGDKVVKR